MIQVAFLKTKKLTPGVEVLEKLGTLKKARNELESWTYNGKAYPIHGVIINRDLADGYNVYIKKDIYKLV